MTQLQAVLHAVIYKMVNDISTVTIYTAYSTTFMLIAMWQTPSWREMEANPTWPGTGSDIKLMVIDKAGTWARSIDLFIGNEFDDENSDIFYNFDKAVELLDSDSYDSPSLLPNHSDVVVKSKEDLHREDLKTIYSLVRMVVFDDTHIDEIAIGAINRDLGESCDMGYDRIHHVNRT